MTISRRSILFDFAPLTEYATDCAFEAIHKAIAEEPSADLLWRPHHNFYIRRQVEDVTERGISILAQIQGTLAEWLAEQRPILKAAGWTRYTEDEMRLIREQLEFKEVDAYTLEDWMKVVDLIIHRYLPAGVIETEAEYLAVRSVIMGKVERDMGRRKLEEDAIGAIVSALPSSVGAAQEIMTLAPAELDAIEYARARAAEFIADIGDRTRHRIKQLIIRNEETRGTRWDLQSQLLDEFGFLNRDWRRIAITENARNANEGFIAGLEPGTRVKRTEAYVGACPFCRKIDGRIFTVVDPAKEDKDGETEVWVGKTNVGRSSSPRKREGDELVDRTPEELWWVAAGVQHPNCFINARVPVYTDRGWRPIGKIQVGDLVLTHNGRFRPVNWVLPERHYSGDAVRFVVSFNGKNKKRLPAVTPEHPFLESRGWVTAGDIKAGDQISALGKVCDSCGKVFINLRHSDVTHCGKSCAPREGGNQFSTDDPIAREAAIEKTRQANVRRMRGMTVEQRRALTRAARAVMSERGYGHLARRDARHRLNVNNARKNYTPSAVEIEIAEQIRSMGFVVGMQGRIPQTRPNRDGRRRYWFPDIILPENMIAVEVDGEYWHRGRDDESRDRDIESQGWTVLRFNVDEAAKSPRTVAEQISRVAMNHADEYRFGVLTVESVEAFPIQNRRLYNFGVEEDESYIVSGGVVVHNCRGGWILAPKEIPGVDPKFAKWVDEQLAQA